MSNATLQLTLREWRRHLLHPLTLTALAAVTSVLALIGPFGTTLSLSLPERIAYWGLLVVAGYVIGYLISFALLRVETTSFARVLRVAGAGVLTGLAMSTLVFGLNGIVFGLRPSMSDLPVNIGTTVAISMIVMTVIDLFNRHLSPNVPDTPAAEQTPPLLDRLPFDKRGPLVALSVEDHYVRVQTTNGEDMLLLRLADAIREVGTTPGTQVHRSHWAAFDQIAQVTKHGDRATLSMTTGKDVPVSRSNLYKLKEAGLLP